MQRKEEREGISLRDIKTRKIVKGEKGGESERDVGKKEAKKREREMQKERKQEREKKRKERGRE